MCGVELTRSLVFRQAADRDFSRRLLALGAQAFKACMNSLNSLHDTAFF